MSYNLFRYTVNRKIINNKYSIFIVDGHPLFLEGIKSLVNASWEVVGQASDVTGALAQLDAVNPDIVLIDLSLNPDAVPDLMRHIRRTSPQTRIVALTVGERLLPVHRALSEGAHAVLTKVSSITLLNKALEHALGGEYYLSPDLFKRLIERFRREPLSETMDIEGPGYESLTPREREVLTLLVAGRSPKEIAHELQIGRATVDVHKANLMRKLEIESTMELVKFAVQVGLVDTARW